MYNIKTLNKIAKVGLNNLGENYKCSDDEVNPDAILVRSAKMHDMELPESVLAIARAGAGVNNIPLDKCTAKGICVFNTPGANANAVKEIVMAGLYLTSRKIPAAIDWAKGLKGKGDEVASLCEKGKSQFAGPEIKGKTLGVIGLGAIGILVSNAAVSSAVGMNVLGYDPYISVDNAWGLSRSIKHAKDLDTIFTNCDYITVHVPLNDSTRNTISKEAIAKMKDGVRILNFARGGLVDEDAIIEALASGKVAAYITDFISDKLIGVEGVITIPHLGASTPESEDNCAVMAAKEVKDYLEQGIITHSVNLPAMDERKGSYPRVCVIHKNVPNMLSVISSVFSAHNLNIENLQSKSRNDVAYSVFDVTGDVTEDITCDLDKVEGVIKSRVIK